MSSSQRLPTASGCEHALSLGLGCCSSLIAHTPLKLCPRCAHTHDSSLVKEGVWCGYCEWQVFLCDALSDWRRSGNVTHTPRHQQRSHRKFEIPVLQSETSACLREETPTGRGMPPYTAKPSKSPEALAPFEDHSGAKPIKNLTC